MLAVLHPTAHGHLTQAASRYALPARSVLGALGCYKLLAWPTTPAAAATLGTIVFFSSLFGDLIESVIKRDAGVKVRRGTIFGACGLVRVRVGISGPCACVELAALQVGGWRPGCELHVLQPAKCGDCRVAIGCIHAPHCTVLTTPQP